MGDGVQNNDIFTDMDSDNNADANLPMQYGHYILPRAKLSLNRVAYQ